MTPDRLPLAGALTLALALALGACSTPRSGDATAVPYPATHGPNAAAASAIGAHPGAYPAFQPVLEVRNEHWAPMRLFLVRPGYRFFLGDVQPGSRQSFPIPRDLLLAGPLQLHASASGVAVDHFTEVPLDQGHRLELRLRKNLYSSRIRGR